MQKVKVVGVYVERKDKILMVQEKGQAWGLWSIPLGHIDENETFKEAAIREVREETGYLINITKELGKILVSDTDYKGGGKDKGKLVEVILFQGEITGGELAPDKTNLLDATWINKNKIFNLPLRSKWLKDIFTKMHPRK